VYCNITVISGEVYLVSENSRYMYIAWIMKKSEKIGMVEPFNSERMFITDKKYKRPFIYNFLSHFR